MCCCACQIVSRGLVAQQRAHKFQDDIPPLEHKHTQQQPYVLAFTRTVQTSERAALSCRCTRTATHYIKLFVNTSRTVFAATPRSGLCLPRATTPTFPSELLLGDLAPPMDVRLRAVRWLGPPPQLARKIRERDLPQRTGACSSFGSSSTSRLRCCLAL